MITFWEKNHCFKKTRRFEQEVNLHFSPFGAQIDPPKKGQEGKTGPVVRTRLSTFEK